MFSQPSAVRRRCTVLRVVIGALMAGSLIGPASAQLPGEIRTATRIIENLNGFTGDLDDGDNFGWGSAGIGDLNGDGIRDMVVGAPFDDDGPTASARGAVYVLFMKRDGTVNSWQKISETQGGLTTALNEQGHFGISVDGIGDLNGDGTPDIVVGYELDDNVNRQGAAHVIFLNANGTVQSDQKINASVGGLTGPLDDNDQFGFSVANLGDVDGDGVTDIAVGAFRDDDGGTAVPFEDSERGAVYVLFMNTDGTVKSEQKISHTQGGLTDPLGNSNGFGWSVDGLGDHDGDGVPDLAVGTDFFGGLTGKVWILLLNSNGTVKDETIILPDTGAFTPGIAPGERWGTDIAALGDLDGDGFGDIAVGAFANATIGNGRAFVLFLDGTGTPLSYREFSQPTLGAAGLEEFDGFGTSLANIGDLDGDGVVDLVVGAVGDDALDELSVNPGAVYVLQLAGIPSQEPYVPPTASLDGRAGRATLVAPSTTDGDEAIDDPIVVVPDLLGSTVGVETVLSTVDGDVAFESVGEFATGAGPSMASTADFDGDGADDIVTSNFAGDSFSYLASEPAIGQPPFQAQVETPLPSDAGPVALGVGDMNGDSDLDVIVAADDGVTVFTGNGSGSFGAGLFAQVNGASPSLHTDLALGDFDGVNGLDAVTASGAVALPGPTEQGFVSVLLNNGSGALTSSGTFAGGQAVASVLAGELTGDGDLDVLLTVHEFDGGPGGEPQGLIQLWAGDGAGGFTLANAFPAEAVTSEYAVPDSDGVHPTYGALGDIDGDGLLDAVFTSADNVSHAPGTFGDEYPPVVLTVLMNTFGAAGTFTVTEVATAYSGKGVSPILQDVAPDPPDGNLDVILVWYEDGAAELEGLNDFGTFVAALVGDGNGDFDDASPNQYLSGDEPGDGDVGEMNTAGDGSPGGPDLVLPNLAANSLSVFLNDGNGGFPDPPLDVTGVDDLDPGTLPVGGVWEGGPRDVRLAQLDNDGDLDAVVYSAWEDVSLLHAQVAASLSLYLGNGSGGLTRTQYLALGRGGDVTSGDIDGNGDVDVIVSQRLGSGGADLIFVLDGMGDGTISATGTSYRVPASYALTGGLAVADVDGDLDLDLLTTGRHTGSGDGAVLVYANTAGVLSATVHDMGTPWNTVRSIDVGKLDGDGNVDIVIGEEDGRLVLAKGDGAGAFARAELGSQAAAVGGGALRLGDLNGDGRLDIVSASRSLSGQIDQSLVHTLRGNGQGAFEVQSVGGLSSVGAKGSLRPLIADMNADGAVDTLLVHGSSDSVSVLTNQLHGFSTYGPGKPGKGGFVPQLTAQGYSTPGGAITINVTDAVGDTLGLFQVGVGQNATTPLAAVPVVLLEFVVPILGVAGQPGAGFLPLSTSLPVDPVFVGAEITMQVLIRDLDAGPPNPIGFSGTNGLAMEIRQ